MAGQCCASRSDRCLWFWRTLSQFFGGKHRCEHQRHQSRLSFHWSRSERTYESGILRSQPVLLLEHKGLYYWSKIKGTEAARYGMGDGAEPDKDYVVPLYAWGKRNRTNTLWRLNPLKTAFELLNLRHHHLWNGRTAALFAGAWKLNKASWNKPSRSSICAAFNHWMRKPFSGQFAPITDA